MTLGVQLPVRASQIVFAVLICLERVLSPGGEKSELLSSCGLSPFPMLSSWSRGLSIVVARSVCRVCGCVWYVCVCGVCRVCGCGGCVFAGVGTFPRL